MPSPLESQKPPEIQKTKDTTLSKPASKDFIRPPTSYNIAQERKKMLELIQVDEEEQGMPLAFHVKQARWEAWISTLDRKHQEEQTRIMKESLEAEKRIEERYNQN